MDHVNSVGLTSDETKALLVAASAASPADRAILEEKVIAAHLPLAAGIARKFGQRGIDLEDLQQVACVALVKAVRRFDPEKGEFAAFAAVTISGEVKKHFRDFGWTVRPPRSVQQLQAEVSRATARAEQANGHEPSLTALAAELGVDRQAIVEATAAHGCFTATSLDAPAFPDGPTIGERLPDGSSMFEFVDEWTSFRPAWDGLDDGERDLLTLRFFDDLSQSKIAEKLGISQMQVSRRLTNVLAKIREKVSPSAA